MASTAAGDGSTIAAEGDRVIVDFVGKLDDVAV